MVSPYLLSRRRGLKEACLEIRVERGRSPPCSGCGLGELCRRSHGDPPAEIGSRAGQGTIAIRPKAIAPW